MLLDTLDPPFRGDLSPARRQRARARLGHLSDRNAAILVRWLCGANAAEIAAEFGISAWRSAQLVRKYGLVQFRPAAPISAVPDPAEQPDFWNNADQSAGADGCWPWVGQTSEQGYGLYKGKAAHRKAMSLSLGRPVDGGAFVCHRCDNRPCVNPRHLYVGDARTNSQDKVERNPWPLVPTDPYDP